LKIDRIVTVIGNDQEEEVGERLTSENRETTPPEIDNERQTYRQDRGVVKQY
jgi:hypothetical protein